MSVIAANGGGGGAFNLILLLAIPVVFYFLLIRPQSKRRREQLQMQSSIEPGARVITTSGMHGTVVLADDDGIVLEIAPGVEARFVKAAVMNVLRDDVDDLDEETEETEDEAAGEQAVDLGKKDHEDDEVKAGQKADKPSA